jgi:hypothetical protein
MTLHEGNDLVGSWARSPNPPQATITSPAEGFDWPNTGPVTVSWNGSDPDGGSLIYRLMALHETDNEVFTLAAELTGDSYVLDLATLPGGGDWTLLVEVSDGLNRASSPTVSGTVAPTNPQVMILEPADGSVHVAGTNVPAVGLAADLQGEISNGDVNWYLDGFWVGSGTAFDLQGVAAGSHQLKLEVYNQYQLAGISTVQFDVVSELQPPVQVSPADGATLVPRPVEMTWVAVPGAISYRVQVSYSPSFVGEVGEAGNITGTEVSFDPPAGEQPVYWRVMAEHGSAPSTWSPTRWFTPGNQASPVEDLPILMELDLTVYPNPFNPFTTISFDLPQNGMVTVEVFDLAGHRVRALSRGHLQAGPHQMTWNGRDEQGRAVGSGVYLVRLVTPQGTRSQRALLLK